MKKNKESAKKLLVLWCVFYIIVHIVLSVVQYVLSKTTNNLLQPLNGLWFVVLGIAVFLFLPWMYAVYRIAKKENNKNVKTASFIAILFMVFFIIGMVAVSILAAAGVKMGHVS